MNARDLVELEPRWLHNRDGEIIGIVFDCPACRPDLPPHSIRVAWKATVEGPDPSWTVTTPFDFGALTIVPSINCTSSRPGSCRFHGWITAGRVTW